jgi:hypothetical protein
MSSAVRAGLYLCDRRTDHPTGPGPCRVRPHRRPVPARVARALLPHGRLGARRRGHGPGDLPAARRCGSNGPGGGRRRPGGPAARARGRAAAPVAAAASRPAAARRAGLARRRGGGAAGHLAGRRQQRIAARSCPHRRGRPCRGPARRAGRPAAPCAPMAYTCSSWCRTPSRAWWRSSTRACSRRSTSRRCCRRTDRVRGTDRLATCRSMRDFSATPEPRTPPGRRSPRPELFSTRLDRVRRHRGEAARATAAARATSATASPTLARWSLRAGPWSSLGVLPPGDSGFLRNPSADEHHARRARNRAASGVALRSTSTVRPGDRGRRSARRRSDEECCGYRR